MQQFGTGTQRAGAGSKVFVSTTELAMGSWSADYKGNNLDTINFESFDDTINNAYDEGLIGPLSSSWNFGGNYDAAAPLWEPTPGVYPRPDLRNLFLYTNFVTDTQNWFYDYARVLSADNGTDVNGLVTTKAAGMNNSVFIPPF